MLEQLGKGAHVGIIRIRSLGDCVLTTPAITLLKKFRPDLRVGVVVEPRFAAVFEDNPDVEDILAPTYAAYRRFAPMLSLNLHGGTRSISLSLTSGAAFRAGFAHYRFARAYNVRIPTAQHILHVNRKVHTAEHLASAMFYLGVPRHEIPPAALYARRLHSNCAYAVIHAMASQPEKAWPANRFLQVAEHLQRHCDLEPVFIGTPTEDLSPFGRYRIHTGSLADTKTLIAGASLFLGNDSGPAHMAAAFGIPLVVLFAASDPVIWAPWKAHAETINARDGIQALATSEVLAALDRLRVRA